MTEKKSFGVAILIWLFLAGLGGHRIYIKERMSILFYYWLITCITFGIAPLVDLFLIKGMIKKVNGNG